MDIAKKVKPEEIVFGTMRMTEYNYSVEYWVNLINEFYDLGLIKHHTSNEYESYPFYCEVLAKFYEDYPNKKIKHIVKLAEPSFQEFDFDARRLSERIQTYLKDLNSDSLYAIQWMWRGNLDKKNQRLSDFQSSFNQLNDSIMQLKSNNLIELFLCFPYDIEFAEKAIHEKFIDGLVVYRNISELEYSEVLNTSHLLNKSNYIIRPLAAGKALEINSSPAELISFSINIPSIIGAIVSLSSIEKLKSLIN
jgi:hypothetical protein